MIEIQRQRLSGSGVPPAIVRVVPEWANKERNVQGYIEQWYVGESSWQGIKVEDPRKLEYPMLIGELQGIPLNNSPIFGINCEDKFYDTRSYLLNGTVLTYGARREEFGRPKPGKKGEPSMKLQISERMPLIIVRIISKTKESIIETASKLHLPLEEEVTQVAKTATG
jgi:hypothetical protein